MCTQRPTIETIERCMQEPDRIRNICILAHVDHGKTTIADSLLAANKLVSKRLAGSIRYLDDRIDEQERGITMKSSAVALITKSTQHSDDILVNVIDTPGHIDFASEVSAALKLCDGALIVVDLVEGICVQTKEAIKHAFTEKVTMILVLNKIDKLILDMHKNSSEIFETIRHTIENCNALIAELWKYESTNDRDMEQRNIFFSPDADNVIFASALDGWGLTTKTIAKLFINQLREETIDSLNSKIWNFDCYIDAKNNRIKYGAIDKGKTNLFVQLCLKTICDIYNVIIIRMDKDKTEKIAKTLDISITRDTNHNDPKVRLKSIMQNWCPIAETIFHLCEAVIQSPNKICDEKVHYLLNYSENNERRRDAIEICFDAMKSCRSDNVMNITHISKMFCIDKRNLSQNKPHLILPKPRHTLNHNTETLEEEREVNNVEKQTVTESSNELKTDFRVIALARVFSGNLKRGQDVFIIPTSNQEDNTAAVKIQIEELYILLGRELVLVSEIPVGNICGIGGLQAQILRTATLSSRPDCIALAECIPTLPIVRNTIEPVNPKELNTLRSGLRLLVQSDSCVQVTVQETGEHLLHTSGDVHLTKCLEDLKTKFAKIEVNVSSPIVSIRETVNSNYDNLKLSDVIVDAELDQIKLSVFVVSLPEHISKIVEQNFKLIHLIMEDDDELGNCGTTKKENWNVKQEKSVMKSYNNKYITDNIEKLQKQLSDAFEGVSDGWSHLKDKLWGISKMSNDINILINNTDYNKNIYTTLDTSDARSAYNNLIINAFNNCCKSGPICEEPLKNCAFVLTNFELLSNEIQPVNTTSNVNMQLAICSTFRKAYERQIQRIMEPMFVTDIQVNTNILGKVYSVVSKRHGKIIDAVGMDEQEKYFLVKAQLPVIDSEGFAHEIRKTTSGQAMPNLKFSHFETIEGDPYLETIDEEMEEELNNVDASIRATRMRKEIRKRKGLPTGEQVVLHAEKQRTLNKKK